MRATLRRAALILCMVGFGANLALAQGAPPPQHRDTFSPNEIIGQGHRFFGTVSQDLDRIVEQAGSG